VGHALLYASVQQELAERVRAEEKLLELNQAHARRNQELGLLNRVIAASTSGIGSTAMLEMVCHELALAFDLPEVGVALLDHGTSAEPDGALTVVAEHTAEGQPSALGAVIPIEGNPSTQYVLENKAPLVVRDAQHDPRVAAIHDLMRQRGVASMLILPLVVRDQAVGTVGMNAFEPRTFAEDEVSLAMNIAGAAAQVLDKTRAEEALRSSQQRLSLHVMHTPLAYIEWDADLRVVDWNPAAERIFGYGKSEAIARHAYEIIVPQEMQPHVTEVWQSILAQTGGTRSTNENVTKDGRTIVCEWYNTPLIDEDGKVIGLASLVEDVTERMRAEDALREARDAADSARRAAEAANRAKSTFLANMSHELRTPLNAILGFSQLMTRDAGFTAEQRENLEIIGRSGEHLLTLISDVLEMSKIEAGRTSVVETVFDLHHLLDDMEDMFRLRAMDKGLELVCERAPGVPQYVRTDESKLRQVLINLLGNAVKFTHQGTVTLRVRYGEESGKLFFEVQDTGVGIAPEDLEKVFEPFVQAPSGLESPEGTGLGLPISRQFVHLLGGELTVTSVPGWGSTFKIDVRAELAGPAEAKARPVARRVIGLEPDQPTYRLLVVEDREANRRLLVKLLSSLGPPPQGFEVREAVNGQEAVEIWEEWEPHLIWMDMRMPVMDGHEATKAIKGTTKGQATVIVALTATAFEEDRRMSLSEGCDDFVRKPFRETEIFDRLAKHLGVRYLYQDTEEASQAPPEIEPVEVISALEKALTRQVLARLPAGWIDKLHRAAAQADGTLVLELVEQIREEHGPVANALTALVDRFRFDVVVALTEEIGERV
jgi:two-component system sensor histidine kinase/response regulator